MTRTVFEAGGKAASPSMKKPPVLVVLPVHNEARSLDRVLTSLTEIARRERYDLLAIDDASTDASLEILNRFDVPTITLVENLGYGASLQTGYKYAVARDYEYLLQLDGDGQHDPRFLPMIRKKLEDHDFVIGSRFVENGVAPFPPERELYRGTTFRRFGIRLFRFLLYAMAGTSVSDPTSGYIGMNRKCMRFLSADFYPHDFPDADVILTLLLSRFKLCEVPVYMYPNRFGRRLHGGFVPIWYGFKVMFSMLISGMRRRTETPGG